MWAYYLAMIDGLGRLFSDAKTDAEFAAAALALSQRAQQDCPTLPPAEAAHLWALSVYGRRVGRAWGACTAPRVSLAWLRSRAQLQPAAAGEVAR
ncbi:MAG: hypothetical protein AB1941_10075 [Gemmatimonadota bacterium]